MGKDNKLFQGVFMWQTLKSSLGRTLMAAATKRNVNPWELLRGLKNPARVSRALDALLHDPPAEPPPP